MPENKIAVTGKTYEYRETFKNNFNGIWDAVNKAWIFDKDRFAEIDEFVGEINSIPEVPKIPKVKLCGACGSPGHTRCSCKIVCGYCEVVGNHFESECEIKESHEKILKDVRYQRVKKWEKLKNNCYCNLDRGVCPNCKYLCCDEAEFLYCVCDCSFKCKTHNIECSCHGSHE